MSRAALCVRGACYQGNGARLDPRAGSGVWRLPVLCYIELTGGQEVKTRFDSICHVHKIVCVWC